MVKKEFRDHESSLALLLIDVINDVNFDDADALLVQALPMAQRLAALEYLKVDTLIITGIAANICMLFTANDAYMRDYGLFVPSDCVASNTEEDRNYSLRQMKAILKADIRQSTSSTLEPLKSGILAAATLCQPPES